MYKQIRTNTAQVDDKVIFQLNNNLIPATVYEIRNGAVRVCRDSDKRSFLLGDEGFVWLVERPVTIPNGLGAIITLDGEHYVKTSATNEMNFKCWYKSGTFASRTTNEVLALMLNGIKVEVLSKGLEN